MKIYEVCNIGFACNQVFEQIQVSGDGGNEFRFNVVDGVSVEHGDIDDCHVIEQIIGRADSVMQFVADSVNKGEEIKL
jgi:hypothetical protein